MFIPDGSCTDGVLIREVGRVSGEVPILQLQEVLRRSAQYAVPASRDLGRWKKIL